MRLPAFVGRFAVRDEIASGGFAVVVRAWDEDLESFVALKILRQELADDAALQLRFLEEARLLRRMHSPNVVTVHDVGRLNDGRPYFVMDYADRGTLAARLKPGPDFQPPDEQSVMALVDAVADGLSAIHEAGVVHRDIKPANILFQRARRAPTRVATNGGAVSQAEPPLIAADERILVGDLGIAKDLVKRAGDVTIMAGTPLYQAPEQDDATAEITPAADVYAATAMLWHVLMGERPPGPRDVMGRLDSLPAAWRELIGQGMALDPDERFRDMEDWRAAIHETLARETAETLGCLPTVAVQAAARCPYKGLAAYQPEDAHFFFGREALIDELVRRMRLRKVLIVGGPSGSGKSSLVRAGLIPALRAGALPGSENWRIALFTPGRDPMAELYFQATQETPAGDGRTLSLDDLIARPTMARHLDAGRAPDRPLVLCIDQFEELFTLAPPVQRRKFADALSAMTDPADSTVRVVLTVRADFYAACAQIPWLAERITDNQVLVGPMTGPELRRAVSEPARPAGLYLERGLVDAIIDEAGSEAGSLPLVAHALVETWSRREGNNLTLAGFRAAGGVAGAISQTADAMFEDRFDTTERAVTKRLFLRLVTPGEGTPDTRRVLARAEIDNDSQADVMNRVVESLTEARLLTVDDTSVQIAHEALLRTWPRLRAWIEESRDDLRMRQRISRAATEWDAEDRDADLLYRGTPLLSALDWAAANPDQLGETARDFLHASSETRARAEAVALERERRTRRLRRAALSGLSVLAAGATAASLVAFLALREARLNEDRAEQATLEADERFAGALGAAAHGLVASDPLLALVLGAEAVARAGAAAPGFDARAAMLAAREALAGAGPVPVGSPIAAGDAQTLAVSPDGGLLAVGRRDGSIVIIDRATRQPTGPSLRGHDGGVRDLDFRFDGRALVSVGVDGTVWLWPVADGLGGQGRKIGEIDDMISGVSFGPDGATVVSANSDGSVRLWRPGQIEQNGEPLVLASNGFQSVAFSPDGRGVVAGGKDGSIHGWQLPSGKALFAPVRDAHSSKLLQIAFDPAGTRFATASSDGTSTLIDYPSGRIAGKAFGPDDRIAAVAFSPDGGVLIGGNDDGALRLWDIEQAKPAATTASAHSRAIADLGASRDGKLLATLGRDQLIRIWRLNSRHDLAAALKVTGKTAKGVAFSNDGAWLAAGDDTGAVQVWRLNDEGGPPTVLRGHEHQVWAVAFAPDSGLLATADRAGEIRLWNPTTGAVVRRFAGHDGAIWSLAFTAEGERLMSASDGEVRFWNLEGNEPSGELTPADGRVTRAVLSPDTTRAAIARTDGRVELWDIEAMQRLREIAAADDVVWSVAFDPDGDHLATGSSDEVVALWDAETGTRLAAFTGQTGGATDLAYLADGVTLAAVDRGGSLHIWDVRSGRRLTKSQWGHAGPSWRIAVHPGGERFATAGDDGWIKIWDALDIARACTIGGPAFDTVRHRQYLGDGERPVACK